MFFTTGRNQAAAFSSSSPGWTSIPSAHPTPAALKDMPTVVKNLYMMSLVVSKSRVCADHKDTMLDAYVESLSGSDRRAISAFCDLYRQDDDAVVLVVREEESGHAASQEWLRVLKLWWPVPASAISAESAEALTNDGMWECMLWGCPRCLTLSGPSLESLMGGSSWLTLNTDY